MNLPNDYKRLKYTLDTETGRYENTVCPIGFNSVPRELKAEERKADQIQADLVIRSIDREPHKFFTGLRGTGYSHVYFGDHYTKNRNGGKKSLVVFRFTPDSVTLTMLYFPGFYPKFNAGQIIAELVGRGIV